MKEITTFLDSLDELLQDRSDAERERVFRDLGDLLGSRPASAPLPKVETYAAGDKILDEPPIDRKWGAGSSVLWAGGEALWICSEGGLGKSAIAQQLALARAGLIEPELFGYPVEVDAGRILYIAADRPRQIYRSFRRMVKDEQRENLNRAIEISEEVPAPLSTDPDALVEFVEGIPEIGTVFIDSLKDCAANLGKDGEGSMVNIALKNLIHSGREVVVLHHDRKPEANASASKKPSQRDVYGSRWLAAGAGSIFFLTGEPNTAFVEMIQAKSPQNRVKNLKLRHDFRTGRTELEERFDAEARAALAESVNNEGGF